LIGASYLSRGRLFLSCPRRPEPASRQRDSRILPNPKRVWTSRKVPAGRVRLPRRPDRCLTLPGVRAAGPAAPTKVKRLLVFGITAAAALCLPNKSKVMDTNIGKGGSRRPGAISRWLIAMWTSRSTCLQTPRLLPNHTRRARAQGLWAICSCAANQWSQRATTVVKRRRPLGKVARLHQTATAFAKPPYFCTKGASPPRSTMTG
jgi:hypothetical protein